MARTIEYQGCQFAFELQGQGEPVVFIQGVGLHGNGWKPQTDRLQSRFECLTFDNRGMGASQPAAKPITVDQMAADTVALMDAANFSAAHLVGHSLGGVVALQVALTFRSRVKSLSLLCTSARGADATRLTWKMAWLGARTRLGTRRMRRLAFLEIVMSPQAVATQDRDELARRLAPIFGHDLADTPPVVMAQLGALQRFDARARLHELEGLPTLVVSAHYDLIFPRACGQALAEGIPGALLLEMPGAAHGVTIEHAEAVNDALAQHMIRR